jgi:hypothetical protein
MELHETKRLLHSKGGSHQTEETAFRMEEIFTSNISEKGLITTIYKQLKKLTSQKPKNPLNNGQMN